MNWLDIAIIVTWGFGFFTGWRMGLFGAIFTTGGLIVGWLLAARLSDKVAELLTDTVSSDTLATVIAYAIIIIAVYVAAQVVKTIVKGIMKMVFLGWVDSLGGLALGLVAGVVLSGALITGLARYSNDLPTELLEKESDSVIIDKALEFAREGLQDKLNAALVESTLVPVFLDIQGSLPGEAMGFIPNDFKVALDVLKAQVEERKQQEEK